MLINLRNALMTGKRLPYDAEVEFLESTGTQYINTGVYADNATAVELLCKYTQSFQDNAAISMDAGNNLTRAFTIETYNSRIYFSFSDTMTQNASLQSSWNQISASQNGLIVNGDSVSVSQAPAFQCEYPLFMFCYGRKGVPIIYGKWQIASCKIYQNGVLVRDYIPVRKGAVGYLYDRVSGKLFGNAGTGDFALGPDVVPVEYIESHGTEYIDTGMSVDDSIGYAVDFEYQQTNTWLLGARSSAGASQNNAWMPSDSTLRVAYGSAAIDITTTKVRHVLSMIGGVVKLDGATSHTFPMQTFAATSKFLIFNMAYNSSGAPANSPMIGRIYSCEIFKGNATALKPIPVRVGTEGAMIDTLTRRIYRNAGTGAFGYGNDLKYPIPA